ncbi:hypothetical protein O6H91_04G020100 [Diphasiastrum complanatum]|uniref:Uncharacterized protein n=2 Tax=Diphasiastrum complanatum TaxID=34168 RepID=A0ACC2D6A9_DIPCM|nr:hypothetical protein O6H91_07G064600 [Diphasiastrum complanatum]KAJ7557988.1 hypothetical protein O6H91_04G020100 [Diphasiastrum complanatum]
MALLSLLPSLLTLLILSPIDLPLSSLTFASASSSFIPTTLDGPFIPVTVPLDKRLRIDSQDLPNDDPRLARKVSGYFPEQIGIAQSVTPHGMWVSWITGEYGMGRSKENQMDCNQVNSMVHYGTSYFDLHHKATGRSLTYSQIYPYANATNYTSGIIHHVLLTGLKPSTRYYYRCGDPYIDAMSKIYRFKTLPAIGPDSFPKRIAFLGDPGLTYNTTSTLKHLKKNNPDLNIFVGDMSYANLYVTNGTGSACYSCQFHTPIQESYQPRWDFWGRYLEPIRSEIPTMVIEGNHEYEKQIHNQTFVAYKARFAVPAAESGSYTKMYYSFNAGGVHFVMLGGYVDYSRTGDQYAWLKKDLAEVDRSLTPWLIAVFHPPWYNSYAFHYREVECMRQSMEELLYKYGVDAVFTGHVHAYERSNRVYNYEYDPCGPVHITIGDGGNREAMAIQHADEPGACPEPASTPDFKYLPYKFCGFNFTTGPAAAKFCWDRQPDWSAFRESSFGHGILEIKNATHALWTWYRNQEAYGSGHIGDNIFLVRQPGICHNQHHDIQ